MGMTIDEAIGIITAKGNYSYTVIENEAKEVLVDTARKYQLMQADYENRLKADMVAMLKELDDKIMEEYIEHMEADWHDIIQQKINSLKGEGEK